MRRSRQEFKDQSNVSWLVRRIILAIQPDNLDNCQLELFVETRDLVINAQYILDGARHGAIRKEDKRIAFA